MVEKHKNYTAKELEELLGENWREQLGLNSIPKNIYSKPIIYSFNEFDKETKDIYSKIAQLIKLKNPNQNVKIWATGSRIKGNWRTIEETKEMKKIYGENMVKYSDYDISTDAKILPTTQDFLNQLGVKVDHIGGESHKVLIE